MNNNYKIYSDVSEYVESLYIKKENGKYKFIGDEQDLRLMLMDYENNKSYFIPKQVIKVNDEWYRLEMRRKYFVAGHWQIEEYGILDGDITYSNIDGEVLNFSSDTIYFVRVDNMNDVDEFLTIPLLFDNDIFLQYTHDKNEDLLHYAWLYNSMFMEEDEIIEKFLTNIYGDLWNKWTWKDLIVDEYI